MSREDPPAGPPTPTVPPSEPEQERRLLEEALNTITEETTRRVMGLHNVRDLLLDGGLDVDEHGFIVDADSGEAVTPYTFSGDAFEEIPSPVDNPLEAYFRPETEVSMCIVPKDRLHLKDLHAVTQIDGESKPVRDDSITLSRLHAHTGIAFNTVTMWSNCLDLVETEDPQLFMNHPGMADNKLTLNCIRCEYTGITDEWVGEDDTAECPDCGGPWKTRGLEICTACQTTHWWDDIDHVGSGMHSEPRCPDCEAGPRYLEGQTPYNMY